MKFVHIVLLVPLFFVFACGESKKSKAAAEKQGYLFLENMVEGQDTGMVQLKGFKRKNPIDVFCQTWRTEKFSEKADNWSSAGQEGMALFKDSMMVLNPGSSPVFGKWWVVSDNQVPKKLHIHLEGQPDEEFQIKSITSTTLALYLKNTNGQEITVNLMAEGIAHMNPKNDPFYPDNIRWMQKPSKKEDDKQLRARVRDCVRFYALYFRDNIKRKRTSISFEGLPDAFDWYDGGMGLPNRDLVSNAWIGCFYNEEQSLKGWDILHTLMKEVDFNWPKGAPNWVYRTEPVLEQMAILLK